MPGAPAAAALLLAVAFGGCTGSHDQGTDASVDGGHDAGALDAAASDAAIDASADGGINCAVVGCGPAPICGQACSAPCGCCPCNNGDTISQDGGTLVCMNGCYVEQNGTAGTPCGSSADCGIGLSCCYPCGVAPQDGGYCQNRCVATCTPGTPGCYGGCFAYP